MMMRIRPPVHDAIRTIGWCWLVVSLILIENDGSWLMNVTGFSTTNVCSIRSPSLSPPPPPQGLSTRYGSQQSRPSQPEPYDNYYDEDDDGYEDADNQVPTESMEEDGYWDEEDPKPSKTRGGLYKVQFDAATEIDPKETQLDWEVCSDGETEALVLLPPEAVERPSAILHFVGGTFFGSLPKIYYRSFLEGLVRNTQCAVVVTPIPVTLLKSPLQHIALGRKLQASFETAWKTVLEDEYGNLDDVPLCGVGHSLGARLLVVLTTLSRNQVRNPTIPAFKSFILLSFTNYGAAAGIPGVSTLLKQSKKQERTAQVKQDQSRRKQPRKTRQDWWLDDGDYGDDDDEEWEQLVGDLQDLLKEQTARVRDALTPNSKDLEFFPTPDQLWKAIKEDGRYQVPQTLLVQFDDDTIDQSAKLAQALHETTSSRVHFARLRGEHLTPISVLEQEQGGGGDGDGGWLGLSSRTSKAIWKSVKGRAKTARQESALRELRQTISSYILDVVTKP